MSTAALRQDRHLDVDAFLAFLDSRPGERLELHEGAPRAMVGGTFALSIIGRNIVNGLTEPARRRGCHALGGFLVEANGHAAYEPVALVLCAQTDNLSRRTDRPTRTSCRHR